MVMPGDRDEILEFQEICLNNTEMTVDIYLPMANVYLPSKHFYEVLYNRYKNCIIILHCQQISLISVNNISKLTSYLIRLAIIFE